MRKIVEKLKCLVIIPSMFEQIKDYIMNVPKPVLIGVVILVLVGAFFLWKKFSSKDKENEVIKGEQQAMLYAENVQQGLEREDEPMMSAMTPQYAKEVQVGLQDLEQVVEPAPVVAATAGDDDDSDLEDYE